MATPDRTRQLVKICGLRDVAAATVAARAGADLIGFLLAESRRRVEPNVMVEIRDALDGLDVPRPLLTGVTVNRSAQDIADLVELTRMDLIQLSGDEQPDLLDDIDAPVIKTIHLVPGMAIDDLKRTASTWLDHSHPAWALLVDAKLPGSYGGTGMRVDWTLAAALSDEYPVFLAGGLMPGNVSEGISEVHPWGVDVSSGVEIDGVKDHALIESFVMRSRSAFGEVMP